MNTDEIWQSLEAATTPEPGGFVRRRVAPEASCDLFLAVRKPGNQRLLQVRLQGRPSVGERDLPETRGLEVNLEPGRPTILQIGVLQARYATIFTALVDDLIAVTATKVDEATAITALLGRLMLWQRFLQQVEPEGLSREAQQGLFGELWTLRRLLLAQVAPNVAVTGWVGPHGTIQDFQLNGVAIEVKTTDQREPRNITIQNERQLDDSGLKELFLHHLALEGHDGTGETLPVLIDACREMLAEHPMALERFEDTILAAGYHNAHAAIYQPLGYTLRQSQLYRVADGFPRITLPDLQPGVGNVQYTVAVGACMPFSTTELELITLVKG